MVTFEPRLAVVESKVDDIESELQRTRSRLHDLESDRATIRLLAHQVREILQNTETVATRAAEKAISLALSQRDASQRNRSERVWGHWVGIGAVGASVGGLAVALAELFTR